MHWDERYRLGRSSMDGVHQHFMQLHQACVDATDEEAFRAACISLREHLVEHFEGEKGQMEACGFPMIQVHVGEHMRVLNEFDHMLGGPRAMAHAYINEGIPAWFDQHVATMDSALAACLGHAGMD